MRRLLFSGLLIAGLVCGQAPRQGEGAVPPVAAKAKKKSRKKLWIGIAVASAVTVATLIAVDKRLSNEGRGIFR